jgi:hypothetical protein
MLLHQLAKARIAGRTSRPSVTAPAPGAESHPVTSPRPPARARS